MSAWMLFAAALAVLAGLAALAAERALTLLRLPTRWAWAAALAVSLAGPFLLVRPAPVAEPGIPIGTPVVVGIEAAQTVAAPRLIDRIDVVLPYAWGIGTLAVACFLAAAALLLHRRRRRWEWAVVGGAPVLVSERTGPAVVGFVDAQIVLPRWTLHWEEPLQRLIVRHEREHVEAGDPRLLLFGLAAVALMPWSPAFWWQLRRLRLAVEVDCDARTLAREGDVRAYGRLLLEVSRRGAAAGPWVAAFSEPASFLERRIRTMTERTPRRRFGRVLGCAAVVLSTAAAAFALPAPSTPQALAVFNTRDAAVIDLSAEPAPASVPEERQDTTKPEMVNAREVARRLATEYPPVLRDAGVGGTVTVRVRVSAGGAPEQLSVVSTPHPALGEAAVRVMEVARFRPAQADGRPVATTISLPVHFSVEDAPARAEVAARAEAPVSTLPGQADVAPQLLNAREVARTLATSYPPVLRDAGIGGTVSVALRVGEDGRVSEARVARADRAELGQAALRVVERMRFRPATLAGRAVPVRITLPVTFEVPTASAAASQEVQVHASPAIAPAVASGTAVSGTTTVVAAGAPATGTTTVVAAGVPASGTTTVVAAGVPATGTTTAVVAEGVPATATTAVVAGTAGVRVMPATATATTVSPAKPDPRD